MIDEFSYCNNGACFNSPLVAANMVNVHEHFGKGLAVLLHFGCFNISPDHSLDEKTSPKHCARLQSFLLRKKTITEEAGSWLEAS